MSLRHRALWGAIACVLMLGGAANAADPVKLVVGYQPYDTISYSAAVIRAKELWKKHLPPGSTVEFEAALQGSIIVNAMVADKQQIGYLGDMPAVVVTTKLKGDPIRLVANTGFSAGQRCNVVMVRADAPKFKDANEAVKWLDGKVVATPKGSCADRFLRQVIEKAGIKPAEVLNQSIEVITTNFRVKKIDAAVLWEPSVSRIGDFVGEGIAREIATGNTFGIPDAGFIAMHPKLIKGQPEIAKAWLRTELEAQQFVLDPKNWEEVGRIVKGQTEGITARMAWYSIYGRVPDDRGGSPTRDTKPFVFGDDVKKHVASTYSFLSETKVIDVATAPEGALDDSLARQVLDEAKVKWPLGEIKAVDLDKAPKE